MIPVSPLDGEKVEVRILGSNEKKFRKIVLKNIKRWSLMMNKSAVNISEVWANSSGVRHQFLWLSQHIDYCQIKWPDASHEAEMDLMRENFTTNQVHPEFLLLIV